MQFKLRESVQRFLPSAERSAGVRGSAVSTQAGGAPPTDRIAPVDELVNVPEFEAMARLVLSSDKFDAFRAPARQSFDKMTFRQRLMVYAMDLDLTTELFGYEMFAPIIVGPVSGQSFLHDDGELETARGASRAKTVMVATRPSTEGLSQVVNASNEPVWFQAYGNDDSALDDATQAVEAGCPVVCVTIGVSENGIPVSTNWDVVERLSRSIDVPVVVKGIMNPTDVEISLQRGAQGVVVSNHGGTAPGGVMPIDVLAAVSDAVDGRVPVIVDGGFQRGTDILKGLALGAAAVMVARVPMWGLAAYGAVGVQTVLELLQTELARNMAASGRPTIDMIDRDLVRFDSR